MTTTRNGADIVEHPIGRTGELILRVQTGDVEVRAVESDVVRVRDLDGLDLEERFAIDRAEGRLIMRPRDRVLLDLGFVRRGRGGGRIEVELPVAATLSIDTASADVRTSGLTGEQRYRTASGALDMTEASGTIGLDVVSGDVAIDGTGEIDLSGRLVSGDLRLDGGRLRSLALATTSGDVRLGAPLDGPGPYSVQTVSGDVEVVAGRPGLRVDAKTLTGEIASDVANQSDSGRRRRSLVVGAGEATLAFKSISGDLRVASHEPVSGGATSQVPPELPVPPEPQVAPEPPRSPAASPAASAADPRLAILHELEAGTIDVETATRRLAAIEDASDE